MNATDLIAGSLARNAEMFKAHYADFSDADMFKRPCSGANNTMWQLGHLCVAEAGMMSACSNGKIQPMPDAFKAKFTKESALSDDPKAFPSHAEVVATFDKVRADTVAWVKTLKDSDLDQPAPEKLSRFAKTVGELLAMTPVHTTMHMGQFQVIRRALGRPVMF